MRKQYGCALGILLGTLINVACAEQSQTFHGHFVWGHEVREFSPCNGETVWWQGDSGLVDELVDYYQANTSSPYQAIYVSWRGQLLPAAKDGFAADYPAVLQVTEVLKWQLAIPPSCKAGITPSS
ncbi:hypothetical protein M0C34_04765 [Agarivorans sp. TSD2052]|uniref:hypothetical protein n=1 Tax=Agarivorans sp. TSD2052 TaxID=2937286 RepID=UPI00200C38B8|nr:hypothetical protein [Agarivorans sp. TSD2052]UPW19594.1 hypothetical protein M0C34_04765 [Agarivorans sp. TSD2052]